MTGKRASQTKTGLMSTARGIALAVLTAVEADQAYSNIKLNELLRLAFDEYEKRHGH